MALPQLHPEVTTLQQDCRLLKEELVRLLTRKDKLLTTVIPDIQAQYLVNIGCFELELLTVRVEINRLLRTIRLTQVAINHGRAPDWEAIKKQLTAEFKEWEAKLIGQMEDLERARERLDSPRLSAEENLKLKRIYHKLVKHLHPDLNPGLPKESMRLWDQVVEAYQRGDLVRLEALWVVVRESQEFNSKADQPSSIENLRSEKKRLVELIKAIMADIEEITSNPPYTLLSKLNNRNWVEAEQTRLREEIKWLKKKKDELKALVDELMACSIHTGERFLH